MRKALPLMILLLLAAPALLLADGGQDDPVTRNEALALKTSVKAVVDALGAPPAGYARSKEEFDLPTSMGIDKSSGVFFLTQTRGEFEFTSGKSGEQLAQEYQTKMMAAQSKGDFAEIQRLTTEMQTTMMSAMGAEMSKVQVNVILNTNPHQKIDPEGVIWEAPGAIALRTESSDNNTHLMLAFDPKALADTQTVSLVDLSEGLHAAAKQKTAVRTIVVEFRGPEAVVTEWAKGVDKGKILALIGE